MAPTTSMWAAGSNSLPEEVSSAGPLPTHNRFEVLSEPENLRETYRNTGLEVLGLLGGIHAALQPLVDAEESEAARSGANLTGSETGDSGYDGDSSSQASSWGEDSNVDINSVDLDLDQDDDDSMFKGFTEEDSDNKYDPEWLNDDLQNVGDDMSERLRVYGLEWIQEHNVHMISLAESEQGYSELAVHTQEAHVDKDEDEDEDEPEWLNDDPENIGNNVSDRVYVYGPEWLEDHQKFCAMAEQERRTWAQDRD